MKKRKEKLLNVELYIRPDEPWTTDVRRGIREAMEEYRLIPDWREYYSHTEVIPKYFIRAGINSLAINGKVYLKNISNAPAHEELLKLLGAASLSGRKFSWGRVIKNHLSFLMAVVIAFFPKCPFCWTAYMSLLTAWGIKKIPYQPWLLPVLCILLLVNIASLYMSRKRHHYGPLILSLAGASLVISNRYWFEEMVVMYVGVAFLVVGSLWNSLSKRMASSVRQYLFGWAKKLLFFLSLK